MNAISKTKNFINSQHFLAYLLALVLATLLLGNAVSSISLGIFVFFSLRYFVIHKYKIELKFINLIPIFLYLLFCATIFWSVNQSKTITGLERTSPLLVLPVVFSMIPKFSKSQIIIIFKYFTISNLVLGMIFLVSAFLNYLEIKSLEVFKYHNLVSILKLNAIYVSLPFLLSLFYLLSKKNKTILNKTAILFFMFLLVLLSSKTIIFVLLIGVIYYSVSIGLKSFNKSKILLAVFVSIVLIGISSFSLNQRIMTESKAKYSEIIKKEKFSKVYPWTGGSIRLLQLRILIEQIQEESIFWKGFGLLGSRDNIKERHLKFNTFPGYHTYNYHNQYAQILSESGIIGLSLFILMLVLIFLKALKSKNFLFIMYCITFCLLFFTESLLWRQKGLFLFMILYCLISRSPIEKQDKNMSL